MNDEPFQPEETEREFNAEPDAESQEMRELLKRNEALRMAAAQEAKTVKDTKTTPASVKTAAFLLTAHGVCVALNAFYGGRQTGNMTGLSYAVIWLGVMIVLAGALCERQAWAWWMIAIFGGLTGVFYLLKVAAFSIFQAGGVIENDHSFSPLLIGVAGIAMLLAVSLLMMPDAKAAFGMKTKPDGLS